jgi:hypothetical protein
MRTILPLTAAIGIATLAASLLAVPANAAEGDRAYWALDEPGTPSIAFDSVGTNDGTNYNITGTGEGYVFNGTDSRVVVPNASSLNPGAADFSYGATIVMDDPPVLGDTDDIIRKGITTSTGGEFKLEIKMTKYGARARCVVKDALKVVGAIQGTVEIANGQPHTITCSKTSAGVTVRVDAANPRTKPALLGSVANSNSLGLGSKAEPTARTGWDWFSGSMTEAWLRVT